MNAQVYEAVANLTGGAAYHRCLLLVHQDVGWLEAEMQALVDTYGWPHLRVGRELPAVLLPLMPSQRGASVQGWLEGSLRRWEAGPVLCSDIDLLFEPSLGMDALVLLRNASRSACLVVAWPGSYAGGVLAYAVPAHAHYRTWQHPEVPVLALE